MRVVISRVLCCVVCAALIPLAGCGKDNEPKGPDKGAVQQYLDENPEAAARLDDEEDVEPDDEGDEG